jgi:hypothetical protein
MRRTSPFASDAYWDDLSSTAPPSDTDSQPSDITTSDTEGEEPDLRNVSFLWYGRNPDLEHASAMSASFDDFTSKKTAPQPLRGAPTTTTTTTIWEVATNGGPTKAERPFWKTKCGVALVLGLLSALCVCAVVTLSIAIPFALRGSAVRHLRRHTALSTVAYDNGRGVLTPLPLQHGPTTDSTDGTDVVYNPVFFPYFFAQQITKIEVFISNSSQLRGPQYVRTPTTNTQQQALSPNQHHKTYDT